MATGCTSVALLLWRAVFLLSISVHSSTSRACPEMSPHYCKNTSNTEPPPPCGYLLRRCNNHTAEIKFGRQGQWYKVLREEATLDGIELQVENPVLSALFAGKDCDFLFNFTEPRPLFAPPPTEEKFLPRDLLKPRCHESDYLSLFPKCLELYVDKPCAAYHLYYTHDEEQNPKNGSTAALPPVSSCRPAAEGHPEGGALIWTLSMNTSNNSNTGLLKGNTSGSSAGNFTLISVGFSRRHRLRPDCFKPLGTSERQCDPSSTRRGGEGHGQIKKKLIIGFSTAAGAWLSIFGALLLYLCWHRNRKTKTPITSSTTLFQTPCSNPFSEIDPESPCDYYPTHVFRYEELHEATNGFSPSNELDEGGHGAVYGGKLKDGRVVAVKRLYENSFRRAEQFMNEIAILSCVRHPNLVALYGCTSKRSRELLLVFEFISNGTVADHLHGARAAEGALTWPVRLRIAVETAKALAYLHAVTPQIVHRDVKTKNILLERDFHVKVADFGLSRLFPAAASYVSTVPQGTPGYVDPDYHRCYQLTDKSDVYSFGVVLAELISSKPAVDITRSSHEINLADMALRRIQNAALDELVDPEIGFQTDREVRRMIELVAELAMMCLQAEREMRPTMESVLGVLRGIEDSRCQNRG